MALPRARKRFCLFRLEDQDEQAALDWFMRESDYLEISGGGCLCTTRPQTSQRGVDAAVSRAAEAGRARAATPESGEDVLRYGNDGNTLAWNHGADESKKELMELARSCATPPPESSEGAACADEGEELSTPEGAPQTDDALPEALGRGREAAGMQDDTARGDVSLQAQRELLEQLLLRFEPTPAPGTEFWTERAVAEQAIKDFLVSATVARFGPRRLHLVMGGVWHTYGEDVQGGGLLRTRDTEAPAIKAGDVIFHLDALCRVHHAHPEHPGLLVMGQLMNMDDTLAVIDPTYPTWQVKIGQQSTDKFCVRRVYKGVSYRRAVLMRILLVKGMRTQLTYERVVKTMGMYSREMYSATLAQIHGKLGIGARIDAESVDLSWDLSWDQLDQIKSDFLARHLAIFAGNKFERTQNREACRGALREQSEHL